MGGEGGPSLVPNKIFLVPCIPVFPESISSILVFPVPQKMLLFPCSQFYFIFVPLFPKSKWPCSLVP